MSRPGLPPRYYQVEKAAKQAETGVISGDRFVELLREVFAEFEHGEDEINDTEVPEEADEVENDLENGLDGIDACKAALEHLAAFAEDQNPQHLERGLSMLADGLTELAATAARNDSALLVLEQPGFKPFFLE